MKKMVAMYLAFIFLLTACAPSSAKIAAAIAETQQAKAQNDAMIQTGIAQTLAAAVTNTPEAPIATLTPELPTATLTPELPPTETERPYLSPTPTLKLDITLVITNKCDVPVSFKVTGAISYKGTLQPGGTDNRQLARGTYTFWDSKYNKTFDYTLGVYQWKWVFCHP
jgi:hypothetical protein